MNFLIRIALGLSVVAVATPISLVVATDLYEPPVEADSRESAANPGAAHPLRFDSHSSTENSSRHPSSSPRRNARSDSDRTHDSDMAIDEVFETVTTAEPAERADTSNVTSRADQIPPSTQTDTATARIPSTTPTTAGPTGSTESADVESGSISGAVCPCTVTGSATLQGDITLMGDLVVDGGNLTARPGVNVDGNGFQIVFMNGGRADFRGTQVFTWSDLGKNVNLRRDVNFSNMRRIMFHMGAGPSVLKYIAVSDSGTPATGDYPLHWHLNGDSTRGTVVEGVVVLNGRHHAFVPHGSHGISFRDTIAKDTKGDPYWWDPPGSNESCDRRMFCTVDNSNDITYEHALADGVTNGPNDDRGFRLSGFLLGAGAGNSVRNSVAINIRPSHIVDCSGFHWPEHANHNEGGNVWDFRNNYSFSGSTGPSVNGDPEACHGVLVWQNDDNFHIINGFTGGGIDHGAYFNRFEYRNLNVPYVEVHAAGWRVRGGNIGTVKTSRHLSLQSPTVQFDNVAIGRFIVDNGSNSGDVPGDYVLNNIGLDCGDIEYRDVVAETRVVIDGTEC